MKMNVKNRLLALVLVLMMALAVLPAALAEAATQGSVTGKFPQALTLGVKETFQLTTDMVTDVDLSAVRFASSKPDVVSVSKKGKITAKKKGSAKIGIGVGDTLLGVCVVTVKAAPKKLELNESRLLLPLGGEARLEASLPEGTASALRFASNNADVAAVTADGGVVATGRGKATITATTYNGKQASCDVYVLGGESPRTMELTAMSLLVGVGDSAPVLPHVQLNDGADAFFGYEIADRKIATVDEQGRVTGKKAGKTILTITTHNGLTARMEVEVMAAPKAIELDVSQRLMGLGGKYLLQVTLKPFESYTTLSFASSDPAVAAVDENGNISAVAPGQCTVTVTTHNGKKASCAITVSAAKE